MKLLITFGLALALSGCAQGLGTLLAAVGQDPARAMEMETKALDTAVTPIPVYCLGHPLAREQFRNRVNDLPRMKGVAEIGIHCRGDAPLVLGLPE